MKAPAFQFYASDFLAGTITFNNEQRGLYIALLCLQWSQGKITNEDAESLSQGMIPDKLQRVLAKFATNDLGEMQNARLESERTKQAAFRAKCSDAGRRSAEGRLKVGSTDLGQTLQPKVNSPISYLLSPKEEEPNKKTKSFDVSAIEIPEALNTAGFLNAWNRWCDHRCEAKKPLTKTSTEHQLKELAGMGESRAIAALHHSVKNGWQGIYEPTKTATALEVPSGPRSWRNTPSSEWTPEDHAAYEKA